MNMLFLACLYDVLPTVVASQPLVVHGRTCKLKQTLFLARQCLPNHLLSSANKITLQYSSISPRAWPCQWLPIIWVGIINEEYPDKRLA